MVLWGLLEQKQCCCPAEPAQYHIQIISEVVAAGVWNREVNREPIEWDLSTCASYSTKKKKKRKKRKRDGRCVDQSWLKVALPQHSIDRIARDH